MPGGGQEIDRILMEPMTKVSLRDKVMNSNRETETIYTTLGYLVEAVTSSAFEICRDPHEAYALSARALEGILRKNPLRREYPTQKRDVLRPLIRAGPLTAERGRGRTNVEFHWSLRVRNISETRRLS